MAINFTNLGNTSAPVEMTPTAGFSLNLKKDSFLDLSKAAPSMNTAKLCASWDPSKNWPDADLDISAFLLDFNQRISNASQIVYFRNKEAYGVSLAEDNRNGRGSGDDEVITINFASVPKSVAKIVCCIVIYDAQSRHQTFGMIENAKVRILNVDEDDREICVYSLPNDFGTNTAVVIGAFNRDGDSWNFQAMGEGYVADLNDLATKFM